jgi:predicted alpha-1,2-mannosidase
MLRRTSIFRWGLLLASIPLAAQQARSIDTFAGIGGGGNTFPGSSLPFAMAKPGPDMGDGSGNAGWLPDADIAGFSQTHVSGTGGGAKYGNIRVQPTTGAVTPADSSSPRADEHGSAGFYAVKLERFHVGVEITSARRTALYRFTYPAHAQANILFDAGVCLHSYANQHEAQSITTSQIRVLSPTEVAGSTSVTGGWNFQTTPYTVFFYAVTDSPASSSGTWKNGELHKASSDETATPLAKTGAWLSFAPLADRQVLLKVGISFISIAQAKQNALSEIDGFDFAKARTAAVAAWDRALAPIDIQGASPEERTGFYTALYHSMLMPVDRTGENPLWQSAEPSYDDFYAIWDTFRTSSPLLTLIAPDRQSAIVRSLIDIYRHDHWLPDARSGNFTGRTQGGSDADFVLADALIKHLPGIDWDAAYRAVTNDAENDPPNQVLEGRGDLADWHKLGYLTVEGVDRPASKHMEYAANDFAIALMAKALGHPDDYQKYLARSGNWRNLWNQQAIDGAYLGFIWSRHRDGTWRTPFTPLATGTWGSDTFYEGNAWTYSTFVPQDVRGLIVQTGGNDAFVDRMNAFFTVPGRFDVTNEPGFLSPYLFIWAGRQDLTAQWIRTLLAANFHAGPKGLPGNDDSGAMSSWYAFGKMGIYPNAGQDVYLIGSPAFASVQMHLANGKTFTISSPAASAANRYVIAAAWNGKPWNRAWFTHEDLMGGGTLQLTMGPKPSTWPEGPPPPSSSDPH